MEFKQKVVGLRKLQDADFASKQQQALAVSVMQQLQQYRCAHQGV